MEKLLRLTMKLSASAGWGIASSDLLRRLHPRAAESIRYSGGDRHDGGASPAVEIGWHSDFYVRDDRERDAVAV